MHNRLLDPFDILHALRARILQTGLLLYREGVDVGSQQQRLAFAVAEDGCESVTADVGVYLKCVEGLEVLDDGGCGFFFAKGELGVRVEPFVCRDQYVVWKIEM